MSGWIEEVSGNQHGERVTELCQRQPGFSQQLCRLRQGGVLYDDGIVQDSRNNVVNEFVRDGVRINECGKCGNKKKWIEPGAQLLPEPFRAEQPVQPADIQELEGCAIVPPSSTKAPYEEHRGGH
jgi:hypothetical protein